MDWPWTDQTRPDHTFGAAAESERRPRLAPKMEPDLEEELVEQRRSFECDLMGYLFSGVHHLRGVVR